MSDLFVQVSTPVTGTTTANASLSGVTAGNTIVAFLGDGSNDAPATHTVSDAQGAYTGRTSAADGTNNVFLQSFTLVNANAGTHSATGTVGAGDQCFLILVEVGTTLGATAFSGSNAAFQNSPGAGANVLSSGSVPVSAVSTLIGFSTDSASVTASDEPTVGTSPLAFTSRANNTSTAIGAFRVESASASSASAATAGPVTTTHQFLTLGVAILNGSVSVSGPPLMGNSIWMTA